MKNIQKLKFRLKARADNIRKYRSVYKDAQRSNQLTHSNISDLEDNRCEFRHCHIAYCLLRGRHINEIEKPAKGNEHNESVVKRLMDEYAWEKQDEAVCVSS